MARVRRSDAFQVRPSPKDFTIRLRQRLNCGDIASQVRPFLVDFSKGTSRMRSQTVTVETGDGSFGTSLDAPVTTAPGDALAGLSTEPAAPRRFYGSVALDSKRLGRDAGRIAEEVVAHLAGIKGAQVRRKGALTSHFI